MGAADEYVFLIHHILIGNAFLKVCYGILKFSYGIGYNIRDNIVTEDDNDKRNDNDHDKVITHLTQVRRKFTYGSYAYYLPARITNGPYKHVSFLAVESLGEDSVGMGRMLDIVLLNKAGIYGLLHRMIYYLSVTVTQIYESHTAVIDLLKHLLNTAVVHINKQHSGADVTHIGKLHTP